MLRNCSYDSCTGGRDSAQAARRLRAPETRLAVLVVVGLGVQLGTALQRLGGSAVLLRARRARTLQRTGLQRSATPLCAPRGT